MADGRYHVALYNPVITKTTMIGLVRLPKLLAIFPTILVLSDSSLVMRCEAGTITNHMKNEPPTNRTALNR